MHSTHTFAGVRVFVRKKDKPDARCNSISACVKRRNRPTTNNAQTATIVDTSRAQTIVQLVYHLDNSLSSLALNRHEANEHLPLLHVVAVPPDGGPLRVQRIQWSDTSRPVTAPCCVTSIHHALLRRRSLAAG